LLLTSVVDIEYLCLRQMPRTELLKGTLDLLILRTLELESRHGFSIAERLEQVTQGTFCVRPGSLFPGLHRLEGEGLIRGAWSIDDRGRRIKMYELTAAGRKRLSVEKKQWQRIVRAVAQVLGEA
jgi:PadR family transcriptional regulator